MTTVEHVLHFASVHIFSSFKRNPWILLVRGTSKNAGEKLLKLARELSANFQVIAITASDNSRQEIDDIVAERKLHSLKDGEGSPCKFDVVYQRIADDVFGIVREVIADQKIKICGLSAGGAIAVKLAYRLGSERVAGLLLHTPEWTQTMCVLDVPCEVHHQIDDHKIPDFDLMKIGYDIKKGGAVVALRSFPGNEHEFVRVGLDYFLSPEWRAVNAYYAEFGGPITPPGLVPPPMPKRSPEPKAEHSDMWEHESEDEYGNAHGHI
jgi:hypothetical protein